jgi:hypothetical protein
LTSIFENARCWFLHSGIQEESGGVARYYRSDLGKNAPVSTEITGYAASALAYLGQREQAARAADFLTGDAWDPASSTFPFEPGSKLSYFFDTGIIARGLLAVHRLTGDDRFRSRAEDAALSLSFDFLGEGIFHPVIELPSKQPLAHQPQWSRSPGCYQLKSALAWREAAGEAGARMFDVLLAYSLATHDSFLAGLEPEPTMDRLHAYCYFLEALLSVHDREYVPAVLRSGIERVAFLLREISPRFERSDVCAQLLRVRLIAHHLGAVELDEAAARDEADRAAAYQSSSPDPRLRGGFWFGRKQGDVLPYMNPVSTAFALQALQLWSDHQDGAWRFELPDLI